MADDPAAILELIDGFRRSKALFAAVKLGIFDGARPPAPGLERLLEACAGLGLLERRGAEWVNSPLADRYLRTGQRESMAGYIRNANASQYQRWARLEEAVLKGSLTEERAPTPAPPKREGAPDAYRDFVAGTHAYGLLSSPSVAQAFDLSSFRSFADLGGATGHLALAIQERYPEIEIAVFDIPPVIQVAREFLGSGVKLWAGNFLTDPLPPADLYGLGKVLHTQSDSNNRLLLKRIYRALPPGGGVLIAERLLDEDRTGPLHVQLSSLNMLVMGGGIERTFPEYRSLLEQAGFQAVQCRKTGALVDAMFAQK
jgi:acetylserotonin O-methyltransferase